LFTPAISDTFVSRVDESLILIGWVINNQKVFLVDDSRVFLDTAKKFLSANSDFEVIGSAYSGEEGLEKLALISPDLILMDMSMPGIGGVQATRFIKTKQNPPKIVIVSIYDNPEYQDLVRSAGADGFIAKSDFGTKLLPLLNGLFENSETIT
jgi:DNA-binding NarL/FixJ family response regulator